MSVQHVIKVCAVGTIAHTVLCKLAQPRTRDGKLACLVLGMLIALPVCDQ